MDKLCDLAIRTLPKEAQPPEWHPSRIWWASADRPASHAELDELLIDLGDNDLYGNQYGSGYRYMAERHADRPQLSQVQRVLAHDGSDFVDGYKKTDPYPTTTDTDLARSAVAQLPKRDRDRTDVSQWLTKVEENAEC